MKNAPHIENKIYDEGYDIPQSALESLARRFLPTILKYYESEEGQKAFEEWKRKQE